MEAWINKLYETFIETEYYKLLLEGLGNTLIITAGALVIGVVIGMLIALIKFFAEDVPSLRPLSFICDLYVTVIRGIPVVVLLLIFYYIIMVSAEGTAVGIITFGINSGAYMAELIRGGIGAVDGGAVLFLHHYPAVLLVIRIPVVIVQSLRAGVAAEHQLIAA